MDDTIVMRLNRANAAMRDQERLQDSGSTDNVQEQACANMWRELVGELWTRYICPVYRLESVANWNRRTKLVEYCVLVVDHSLTEKQKALEDQSADPATQWKTQAAVFADEVKVRNRGF